MYKLRLQLEVLELLVIKPTSVGCTYIICDFEYMNIYASDFL